MRDAVPSPRLAMLRPLHCWPDRKAPEARHVNSWLTRLHRSRACHDRGERAEQLEAVRRVQPIMAPLQVVPAARPKVRRGYALNLVAGNFNATHREDWSHPFQPD